MARKQNLGACTFEGCSAPAFCKELCRTHYWQQYVGRTLTPRRPRSPAVSIKERFMLYVQPNAATGCWDWIGAKHHTTGYGLFWFSGEVGAVRAHRAAWTLLRGPIPEDNWHVYGTLHVLHRCDNKLCVYPGHLFLGTQRINMLDHKKKNGPIPRNPRRGEKHPFAKLTADMVRAIRRSTDSQAALGRQYGISRQTVGEIQRQEIWKHVKD